MHSVRASVLLSLVLAIILGSGIYMWRQGRPSADQAPQPDFTLLGSVPVEFKIFPKKAWISTGGSKLFMGVRGLNGFSGKATLNFSGLPEGSSWVCGSNCDPAGAVGDAKGMGPLTVPVVANEWRVIAPIVMPMTDGPHSDYLNYTMTVTASVSGHQPINQTVPVLVSPSGPREDPSVPGLVNPAVVGCEMPKSMRDQGYTQPLRPANKQTVTAGGTVTYSCNMRVGGYIDSWVNGTAVQLLSNDAEPDSAPLGSGMSLRFSPSNPSFDKPSHQWQPEFIADESKDIPVTLTVETSSETPAGVYALAIGQRAPAPYTDYIDAHIDAVLTVKAAAVGSKPSAAPSLTETPVVPLVTTPPTETPSPALTTPQTTPSAAPTPTQTTPTATPSQVDTPAAVTTTPFEPVETETTTPTVASTNGESDQSQQELVAGANVKPSVQALLLIGMLLVFAGLGLYLRGAIHDFVFPHAPTKANHHVAIQEDDHRQSTRPVKRRTQAIKAPTKKTTHRPKKR